MYKGFKNTEVLINQPFYTLLNLLVLFFGMRYSVVLALMCMIACQSSDSNNEIWARSQYSLKDSKMRLDLVAFEPMINAPIALDIDHRGRYWVLEMPDYMPDIDAATEDIPQGRIVIISDTDGDGLMDHSKIFMDKLHQPRALALVYGGLLYAETPNLYFVPIKGSSPGEKILVDSTYAVGGNVEHQPNGLLYNIDNWIYSAKGRKRYRRINGIWEIEPTSFRGQWGISNDTYGRLYYNDNSNGLYGDYVLPNTNFQNPYIEEYEGIGEYLLRERNIYPVHATPINRGYVEGALTEEGIVKNMTSACGPYFYKNSNWPKDYRNNAFISIPEGNLIKRLTVINSQEERRAYNYYNEEEWLTSTDKAFRPVNLYEDFNGDMLIVDFHRGIIQHKTYMTNYLREKIMAGGLDTIYGYGRILKISEKHTYSLQSNFQYQSDAALVQLLDHPQYRMRIEAQKEIVHKGISLDQTEFKEAVYSFSEIGKIHALHCAALLYEEDLLDFGDLLQPTTPWFNNHYFTAVANASNLNNQKIFLSQIEKFVKEAHSEQLPYLAYALGKVDHTENENKIQDIYRQLINKDSSQLLVQMSLAGNKANLSLFNSIQSEEASEWSSTIQEVKQNQLANQLNRDHLSELPIYQDDKTTGRIKYNQYCASCHNHDGQGMKNLAPSLKNALLVEKGAPYVAASILGGIKGAVTINDEAFEFAAYMPGLIQNQNISDQDIKDISNYVTNAFRSEPDNIQTPSVTALRKEISSKTLPLRESEVIKIVDQ